MQVQGSWGKSLPEVVKEQQGTQYQEWRWEESWAEKDNRAQILWANLGYYKDFGVHSEWKMEPSQDFEQRRNITNIFKGSLWMLSEE